MKKFIITSFILCFSLSAFAEINPYISIRAGYEKTKEKASNDEWHISGDSGQWFSEAAGGGNLTIFDEGAITGNLAIGAKMNKYFRTEISYTYKKLHNMDIDMRDGQGIPNPGKEDMKITQQTILANLFLYPLNEMIINPFVGAGAGIGILGFKHFDTETNFAYALYIGADYTFAKHWSVEVMGTYNSILAPYSNANDIQNFGGSLGVRYNF
ncbi:opacity protein-like surface antigen [Elusimicrobium posterum]|uniref:outer membrane beta-barrel protein n=1 Tax=Elusimicrobium posterum TaxID=3116653 RepID=UPI003C759C37